AGTFTATLTVTDGRSGSATATSSVTITSPPPPPVNRDPIANANGPYSGLIAQTLTFNSTGSSDPDGDALQFAWTFGDGSNATGPSRTHACGSAGSFTATLTVSDGRGGIATSTSAVTITEATTPVTLTSLTVSPTETRFTEVSATSVLQVTGHYSD